MNVTDTERFLHYRVEALENKLEELETTNKILKDTERFLHYRVAVSECPLDRVAELEALENKLAELESINKLLTEENRELKLMQLRSYLILSEDKNRHKDENTEKTNWGEDRYF